MSELRFICPDCEMNIEDRKKDLLLQIENWVNSDALAEMVGVFDNKFPQDISLKEKIEWLNNFASEEWDYRKKQANSGERWAVKEDEKVLNNGGTILECATELGLVGIAEPLCMPDIILPLGGAMYSNLTRPQMSREIVDKYNISDKKIVGLSGKRPINEAEMEAISTYSDNAQTEYDAMCSGLVRSFDLTENEYDENITENENINLEASIRYYNDKYKGNEIYSVAAPSSDPSRRANSQDTFEFFLKEFNVKKGDKLLLVTTAIYVPFQLLRFLPLAIENGFYVDCIGVPRNGNQNLFNQYTNYCQETKSVINSIKSITDKWI